MKGIFDMKKFVCLMSLFSILGLSGSIALADDPSLIVEFRIKMGTSNQAWNLRTDPVVVNQGDTLRIYNDDSISHQLHTNGAPCPHGNPILPGNYGDCVISKSYDPEILGPLYDHQFGKNASFWVLAK